MESNKNRLYIRYALFFMDLMKVMRNKESMQQLSNNLNPDGNKFEVQYMCKVGVPEVREKKDLKNWEDNTYIA